MTTLYHYTKLQHLKDILRISENGEPVVRLRLTDSRFMNDPIEVSFFREIASLYWTDILSGFEHRYHDTLELFFKNGNKPSWSQNSLHFVFSMTNAKDSLLFWGQDYAREHGVCIHLNKEILNIHDYISDFGNNSYAPSVVMGGEFVVPVSYLEKRSTFSRLFSENTENQDVIDKIRKNLNDFIPTMFSIIKENDSIDHTVIPDLETLFLETFSPMYKEKCWEHEQEERLIINAVLNREKHASGTIGAYFGNGYNYWYPKEVQYEKSKYGIAPVLYKDVPPNTLTEITLSCGCHENECEVIRNYLHSIGFGNIRVTTSKVKYR